MGFVVSSRVGVRRAAFGGLAALTCAGTALIATGAPALADFAATGGGIIIVDKDATSVASTQGATEVQPGATAQPVDDVVVGIPNTFDKNDTIALALFDRSSGAAGAGLTNTDALHKLVYNGTPTVTVDTTGAPAGTVTPTVTVAPAASTRANGQGNDEMVLKIGNKSAGAAFQWKIKVSGLKVDTGANVTPGEIRMVPFATNHCGILGCVFTPGKASPVFAGNLDGATPTIKTYTVPGYVVPAKMTQAAPTGVAADGAAHAVGTLTISEVSPVGLQAGTYTVTVKGAAIKNDATTPVAVAVAGASGEAAAAASATVVPGTAASPDDKVQFTLNQTTPAAANANKATITLQNLRLASSTGSDISYTLTGGSISQYYATAGTSPAIGTPTLFPPDTTFAAGQALLQTDIVAPSITTSAVSTPVGGRIGGTDRYATAAQVAFAAHPGGTADTVILASGQSFPDALSAGFLSQRAGGVSVLLTRSTGLSQPTENALRSLKVKHVFVVGGPAVVPNGILTQVADILADNAGAAGGSALLRLSGANRYATNQVVNDYAATKIGTVATIGTTTVKAGGTAKPTAILATGEDYADALAATPATAGNGSGAIPLILTRSATLTQTAKDQLTTDGIKQVVVAGGTGAVSSAVESDLGTMGISVKRLAGANRYGTATAIADFETAAVTPTATVDGGLGFDPGAADNQTAGLATGEDFADALAAGPFAAVQRDPILLTTGTVLQSDTGTWLTGHKARYSAVLAFGLSGAVSDAVLQAAQTAIL